MSFFGPPRRRCCVLPNALSCPITFLSLSLQVPPSLPISPFTHSLTFLHEQSTKKLHRFTKLVWHLKQAMSQFSQVSLNMAAQPRGLSMSLESGNATEMVPSQQLDEGNKGGRGGCLLACLLVVNPVS